MFGFTEKNFHKVMDQVKNLLRGGKYSTCGYAYGQTQGERVTESHSHGSSNYFMGYFFWASFGQSF